jgi:hypothetical protein
MVVASRVQPFDVVNCGRTTTGAPATMPWPLAATCDTVPSVNCRYCVAAPAASRPAGTCSHRRAPSRHAARVSLPSLADWSCVMRVSSSGRLQLPKSPFASASSVRVRASVWPPSEKLASVTLDSSSDLLAVSITTRESISLVRPARSHAVKRRRYTPFANRAGSRVARSYRPFTLAALPSAPPRRVQSSRLPLAISSFQPISWASPTAACTVMAWLTVNGAAFRPFGTRRPMPAGARPCPADRGRGSAGRRWC